MSLNPDVDINEIKCGNNGTCTYLFIKNDCLTRKDHTQCEFYKQKEEKYEEGN